MSKKASLLILIILSSSCSTQRKSKMFGAISGGLICGTIGAYIGKELSPNEESDSFNAVLGASTGSILCGIGGSYLGKAMYEEDPRNQEMEPIKIEKKNKYLNTEQESVEFNQSSISFSDLSITNSQSAKVPLINGLPKELKEKIDSQEIIKHRLDPQLIETKDGRKLYFSGGIAIEHKYIPKGGM